MADESMRIKINVQSDTSGIKELADKLKWLKNNVKGYEERISGLNNLQDVLIRDMKKAENEYESLKKATEGRIHALQSESAVVSDNIAKNKKVLKQIENEIKSSEMLIFATKRTIERRREEGQVVDKELADLKNFIAQKKKETLARSEVVRKIMEEEISHKKIRDRIAKERKSLQVLIEAQKRENNERTKSINAVKRETAVAKKYLAETKKQISTITKRINAQPINVISNSVKRLGNVIARAGEKIDQFANSSSDSLTKITGSYENFNRIRYSLLALNASVIMAGRNFVKTASDFEQYRIKLQAVTKSQERSIQIVHAGVQLRVYDQQIEKTLPLAAALASAMNRDVSEAARAMGRAIKGSTFGYRQLRETFGITTFELEKFGAIVNKGKLVLREHVDGIEKAAEALKKLVKFKYGYILELQAETAKVAMANLRDAFVNMSAEIGDYFLPSVKGVAKDLKALIGLVRKNKGVFAGLFAVGTGAVGGISAITGFSKLKKHYQLWGKLVRLCLKGWV